MAFDRQPTLAGKLVTVRPLCADDHAALYAVASDPLVWEQHPDYDRYKPDVFDKLFAESLESGGALIVHDAATDAVIGSSRYHGYDETRSEVEIGWTFLARSHWGGAYNGDMKRLMLEHAFRFVDSVVLLIGPRNARSRRAAEKIGAVDEGLDADGRCVYRITASAFARRRAGR